MRILASAVILLLAGCGDPIELNPTPVRRPAPDPAAICPGNDCFGMHQIDPKAKCLNCGVAGLPLTHFYCTECAADLQRCAHCGRRKPKPAPVPAEPKEEPRAPEPPPREKPPAPPPKAPEPEKEAAAKMEKLVLAPVELTDPDRKSHGVVVFAADSEGAKAARDAHRDRKQDAIDRLHKTRAGRDAALYVIWGYHPKPNLKENLVQAEVDPETKRIRVTVPPWSGGKPAGGIGMDWRAGDRMNWAFVGFRADLSQLPAGDYSVEVLEVENKGGEPRELYKGTITLSH
jgi:hypothetical protein